MKQKGCVIKRVCFSGLVLFSILGLMVLSGCGDMMGGDGSCDGKDWLLFYPDWGRTDCLIP